MGDKVAQLCSWWIPHLDVSDIPKKAFNPYDLLGRKHE